LGWTGDKNLHIDYRWSDGDSQKPQAYAKELVATRPDVLVTRSTPATVALMRNRNSIPIVLAVVSDPVGEGFAKSVARPGGNATGFTNAEASLTSKWVGLLKETKPGLGRIGFIFDPKVAPGGRHLLYEPDRDRGGVDRTDHGADAFPRSGRDRTRDWRFCTERRPCRIARRRD
jgi:putative ABC transport system substrate-binding protein